MGMLDAAASVSYNAFIMQWFRISLTKLVLTLPLTGRA